MLSWLSQVMAAPGKWQVIAGKELQGSHVFLLGNKHIQPIEATCEQENPGFS